MTQSEVERFAADVAAEYKSKTYAQLEDLLRCQRQDPDCLVREGTLNGVNVSADVTLARYGRLRPRISVEVVAGIEGEECAKRWTFVYFECFPSGRVVSPSKLWSTVVAVLIFGAGAIAVLRVVWWLTGE